MNIKDASIPVLTVLKNIVAPYTAALTKFIDTYLERAALYVFDHKGKVLAGCAALTAVAYALGAGTWAFWAYILLIQNWAFTYVSRARNSGSLTKHLKAGFFSNGVWFASQTIIVSKLFDYVQGKYGLGMAIFTGLYYTAFTLTGSILAHAQSLRSEKGMAAVGANKKFKQVTVEEWKEVKDAVRVVDRIQDQTNGLSQTRKYLRESGAEL